MFISQEEEWLLTVGLGTDLWNRHILSERKYPVLFCYANNGCPRVHSSAMVKLHLGVTVQSLLSLSGNMGKITALKTIWHNCKCWGHLSWNEAVMTRLPLNHSLILQTAQSMSQPSVSSPLPSGQQLGLQEGLCRQWSERVTFSPVFHDSCRAEKVRLWRQWGFVGVLLSENALWFSVRLQVFPHVILTACLLPTSTILLIADIILNMHSATAPGNLKFPANKLLAAARIDRAPKARPESKKHWPN